MSERKILMVGVLLFVVIIIICIFISDWLFNRSVLTETLVGILIGTPLGWIGAYVAFYTVESSGEKDRRLPGITPPLLVQKRDR